MISKKLFGTLSDGREVDIYELKNANGVSASVITYGATWQSLFAPDRDGNFEDVLIGFDDLKGHVERSDYQGQIVGRYANRICGGHFTVNGKEIDVIKNENGKTCLHGGGEFSHAVWAAKGLYFFNIEAPSSRARALFSNIRATRARTDSPAR